MNKFGKKVNSRYPTKFLMSSSHSLIVNNIHQIANLNSSESNLPLRILDIGCSVGYLYDSIKNVNVHYEGVEPYLPDALMARQKGLTVHIQTAEQIVTRSLLQFNTLVFADVLEHLINPEKVLSASTKLLTTKGYVIISCPNVAHITNRISLLFGKWNYQDRGILDRTHLRFFTRKTLKDMVRRSGFEIVKVDYSSVPLEALFNLNMRYLKLLDFPNRLLTLLNKGLFGYQTIIVAKLKD